tara:strand:+ start:205 stop:516 length:312 start_codon:yes stop_codon:yes gene_type:complete
VFNFCHFFFISHFLYLNIQHKTYTSQALFLINLKPLKKSLDSQPTAGFLAQYQVQYFLFLYITTAFIFLHLTQFIIYHPFLIPKYTTNGAIKQALSFIYLKPI